MPEAVLTSTVDQVRIITLNRPEARNAIDSDLSLGVFDALAALDADDGVRVGILTGAGGDFCAGMDLKAFARLGSAGQDRHHSAQRLPQAAHRRHRGRGRRRRPGAGADCRPPRRLEHGPLRFAGGQVRTVPRRRGPAATPPPPAPVARGRTRPHRPADLGRDRVRTRPAGSALRTRSRARRRP